MYSLLVFRLLLAFRSSPAKMDESQKSTNPFARVLLFYYLYQRSKITATDFEKIAKKYAGKGDKLLVDLQTKYTFPIPESVWSLELTRLCAIYPIPPLFLRLMSMSEPPFDTRTDVYSSEFNAEHVLFSGNISVSYRNAPHKDNLSRIRYILPGYSGPGPKEAPSSSTLTSSTSASSLTDPNAPSGAPKARHLFELIAEEAQRPKITRGGDNHEAGPSPLALLAQFMRDRVRVRIVLRRHNRLEHFLQLFTHCILKKISQFSSCMIVLTCLICMLKSCHDIFVQCARVAGCVHKSIRQTLQHAA